MRHTALARHKHHGKTRELLAHASVRRLSRVTLSLIISGSIIVAGLAGIVGTTWWLNSSRNIIASPLSTRAPSLYGAENILLLGSDTRGSIDTGSTADDPTASEGSRSDTMILVHIPADRKSVQVITLLRDMYVPIKDNGYGKLNWAMFFGGVPLAVDTVENLLDTKIDHVVLIDFHGVETVSTALGGVTINNPTAFTQNGFYFPQGKITVSGAQALAFVRGRHAFAEGDKRRVLNQQLFLQAAADKALAGGTLTNPVAIAKTFSAIKDAIAVDEGLNVNYVTQLATSFMGVSAKAAHFMVLPTKGEFSRGPHTFWNLDTDQLAVIKFGLATDSLNLYTPPASTPAR